MMPDDNNIQNIAPRRQVLPAVAKLQFQRQGETQVKAAAMINAINALITPIDSRGRWGNSHVVEVKDFNERSITFHHPLPLSDRRAMVVLESPQLGRLTAEVDLTWCRFHRSGRYTSGGRFVQRAKNIA